MLTNDTQKDIQKNVRVNGTVVLIAFKDTITSYPFEFDLFVPNHSGEIQSDMIRVAAENDAEGFLATIIRNGDSLSLVGWLDDYYLNRYKKQVLVVDNLKDIIEHRPLKKPFKKKKK